MNRFSSLGGLFLASVMFLGCNNGEDLGRGKSDIANIKSVVDINYLMQLINSERTIASRDCSGIALD